MKFLFILALLVTKIAVAVPVILNVESKVITVNGKQITVATVNTPDGIWGYWRKADATESPVFDVLVHNKLSESTMLHWHGLILPNNQDGVPGLTNVAIAPGGVASFRFPLVQTGTYWMHSHEGLQLQDMIAAPLILESKDDVNYQQQIVVFQDYSQLPAAKVLANLKSEGDSMHNMSDMHNMTNMHDMPDMHEETMGMNMDLNDVKYEAYLTNYHDNSNPEIIQVKAGSKVKLRFINAASASNFWIKLGKLRGQMVAIDGSLIKPIAGNKFQLALGQRLDVIVTIPKNGGTFKVLGQVEGLTKQTGLILTTSNQLNTAKIALNAAKAAPALNYNQELQIHSINKVKFTSKAKLYRVKLSGTMQNYTWQLNNEVWPNISPLQIKHGENVVMEFDNQSMMSHSMHIHGYTFKIVAINGKNVDGALRDTILVMPKSKLKIEFVADRDGKWMLHCHTLYHMHAGMMTYLNVDSPRS